MEKDYVINIKEDLINIQKVPKGTFYYFYMVNYYYDGIMLEGLDSKSLPLVTYF